MFNPQRCSEGRGWFEALRSSLSFSADTEVRMSIPGPSPVSLLVLPAHPVTGFSLEASAESKVFAVQSPKVPWLASVSQGHPDYASASVQWPAEHREPPPFCVQSQKNWTVGLRGCCPGHRSGHSAPCRLGAESGSLCRTCLPGSLPFHFLTLEEC